MIEKFKEVLKRITDENGLPPFDRESRNLLGGEDVRLWADHTQVITENDEVDVEIVTVAVETDLIENQVIIYCSHVTPLIYFSYEDWEKQLEDGLLEAFLNPALLDEEHMTADICPYGPTGELLR